MVLVGPFHACGAPYDGTRGSGDAGVATAICRHVVYRLPAHRFPDEFWIEASFAEKRQMVVTVLCLEGCLHHAHAGALRRVASGDCDLDVLARWALEGLEAVEKAVVLASLAALAVCQAGA